jgi:hypothetical protein
MASNCGGFAAGAPARNEGVSEEIMKAIGLACAHYGTDVHETPGESSMAGAGSRRLRELLMAKCNK